MKKDLIPIPLIKNICGNCSFRDDKGECIIQKRYMEPERLACFWIGRNFKDKGFENKNLTTSDLNIESIMEEVRKELEKYEGRNHLTH